MAVTTKKLFPATSNATTTVFNNVGIQLNNQDDLDVYVTLSGGTRVLQLRQSSGSTATSSHPQVNNTDGLYFPAVSAGTTLYNYTLSTDNNTITFNSALPQGAVVFCERRTRDADSAYTTFASGSTIRATDLNNSSTESNFTAQDARNKALLMEGAIFNGDQISPVYVTSANIVDGTIQTADIAADQITNALIADNQIDSEHYVDGSIDHVHLANDVIDGDNIQDDVINSEHIAAGAVDLEHMSANSVDSDQYVDGSIDLIHMSANSVDSNQYVDGSIDRVHLSADIIDSTKLADNAVNSEHYVDGSIDHVHLANDIIDGDNIQDDVINSEHYVAGSIDHEHLANDIIDGDNIQDNAVNTEHIQTNAVTDNEIATGTLDNRYYTETELDAGQLDNRYYTEAELNGGQLNSLYFTEAEITNGAADSRYYTETELDAGQLDNRYFTETELTSGALDGRYYTETEAEARFLRQDSSETIASGATWSSSDAFVATTAAIDARVIELVDDVGGFVPIANETSFPTSNPDINNPATGGTIVSVKAASTNLAPSGTTVTIANGRGSGLPVVITGVTATIPSGFGFLVETTSTDHTYAFHRLVPVATQVATVANNITNIVNAGANVADINNFADLYQISTSAPTARGDSSSLQVGDLWFDSSSNKVLMIYDGSSGDGFSPATPNQSDLTNINIVAGQITFQEDLGLITNAVNTGSGNNSVNTVATDIANVNTVAGSISNVNSVAGNATNINAVAADAADIGAVAGKATEIGRLGTADAVADMNTLGTTAIVSDMDTLADISSNITTVAGIASNVTTVAGNNSNVSTVAGVSSNVTTVANSIANVNTTAGSIANVNTTAGSISNVNTVGAAIANVNTTASNINNVNSFAATYQIASSDPSTDGAGNALSAGDLYFNTSSNELRVHNGSTFQGGVTATGNLAGLGANTFTGLQTLQNGLAVTGNITVSGTVDGVDIAAFKTSFDNLNTDLVTDTTPQLGGALDGQNNNMSNIGTIDGANLQLDFGTIA